MQILPREQLEIDSPLPKDELLQRLAEVTWPERFFRDPTTPNPKRLEGRFEGDAFLVRRAHLGFRTRGTKLTAQADGVVESRQGGSRLTATLSFGWHGGLFLSLGLGLPLAIWALLLGMALVGAIAWSEVKGMLIGFPLLLVVGALAARGGFAVSARNVKAALREAAGMSSGADAGRSTD
jgi:hypothetical protein